MEKSDIISIGDVVRYHRQETPDAVAFTFEGDEMNYARLDEASNRAAQALASKGVSKGDRIAYMGKNSHLYFEILVGAAKLGAVMTPVNWRLAPPEVAYILNDCQAKILFIGPGFDDLVRKIKDELQYVELILGSEKTEGDFPGYPVWRDGFDLTDPMVSCAEGDDALQLYTSGTTGHPKGAIMTNGSIFSSRGADIGVDDLRDWQKSVEGEITLLAMPCFHISGTGT